MLKTNGTVEVEYSYAIEGYGQFTGWVRFTSSDTRITNVKREIKEYFKSFKYPQAIINSVITTPRQLTKYQAASLIGKVYLKGE